MRAAQWPPTPSMAATWALTSAVGSPRCAAIRVGAGLGRARMPTLQGPTTGASRTWVAVNCACSPTCTGLASYWGVSRVASGRWADRTCPRMGMPALSAWLTVWDSPNRTWADPCYCWHRTWGTPRTRGPCSGRVVHCGAETGGPVNVSTPLTACPHRTTRPTTVESLSEVATLLVQDKPHMYGVCIHGMVASLVPGRHDTAAPLTPLRWRSPTKRWPLTSRSSHHHSEPPPPRMHWGPPSMGLPLPALHAILQTGTTGTTNPPAPSRPLMAHTAHCTAPGPHQ